MAVNLIKIKSGVGQRSVAELSRAVGTRAAQWDGFQLEVSSIPGGEFPGKVSFNGHCIFGQFPATAEPVTKEWREAGRDRTIRVGGGILAISSGQEISDLRWGGAAEVVGFVIDDTLMKRTVLENGGSCSPQLRLESCLQDKVFLHLLLSMRAELIAGCPSGRLFSEQMGNTAVHYALRHFTEMSCPEIRRGGLSPARLRRVKEYIDSYLDADLGLSALAVIAGMSTYHFGKSFKMSTGVTVHHYVLDRRIHRARVLLRNQRLRVCDVAGMVGIPNQSHFARVFSKSVKCSPRAFRGDVGLRIDFTHSSQILLPEGVPFEAGVSTPFRTSRLLAPA
jgi:AraC family transcriptional regulator